MQETILKKCHNDLPHLARVLTENTAEFIYNFRLTHQAVLEFLSASRSEGLRQGLKHLKIIGQEISTILCEHIRLSSEKMSPVVFLPDGILTIENVFKRLLVHSIENSMDSHLQAVEDHLKNSDDDLNYRISVIKFPDKLLFIFVDDGIGLERSDTSAIKALKFSQGLPRKGRKGIGLSESLKILQKADPESYIFVTDNHNLGIPHLGATFCIELSVNFLNKLKLVEPSQLTLTDTTQIEYWETLASKHCNLLISNSGKLKYSPYFNPILRSQDLVSCTLIRHGETYSNISQLNPIVDGQPIPKNTITPDGLKRSHDAALKISDQIKQNVNPNTVVLVVTSTQQRTIISAEPLINDLNHHQIPVQVLNIPELNEISLGFLDQLKSRKELKEAPGTLDFFKEFKKGNVTAKIPDGESYAELLPRAAEGLQEIADVIQVLIYQGHNVHLVIFGHRITLSAIRVLSHDLSLVDPNNTAINWRSGLMANSEPMSLDVDK